MVRKEAVPDNRLRDGFLKSLGMLIVILIWEFAPRLGWIETWYIPSCSSVLRESYHLCGTGFLITHLLVTMWRIVTGLLIAAAIALPSGFFLGRRGRSLAQLLSPMLRLFSHANPFSLLPVFILCFGIGETAKLAVVVWVCLWPVLFKTMNAVQTVDSQWIKAARSMAIPAPGLIFKILFPGAAPEIFVGLKIGIQRAFVALIAGEMLGATAGIGWVLYHSFHNGLVIRMFVASFGIIVLGVALDRLLNFLERRLFFWRNNESRTHADFKPKVYQITGHYALIILGITLIGIFVFGGWEVRKVGAPDYKTDPAMHTLYGD